MTIAISAVFLGETSWSGSLDTNAWRSFGYDIDGELSDKTSMFHCRPKAGVPKSKIQTDGDGGIDNSWGSNLIPIIQNLAANPSGEASAGYYGGQIGQLFHFQNLTPGASQNGVSTQVYTGAPASPSWSGNDVWPVTYESVNAGDVNQPKLAFPSSYVVGNTWVSGASPSNTTLDLRLPLSFPLPLRIQHLTITAQLLPNGEVSQGIISGVVNSQELIDEFKKVAGSFDPALCSGPTFDSVAQQLANASDIMTDGTQHPTMECDAISIGIGFQGKLVQLGPVASPAPPIDDPCN